jgi:hypothetical protein
MLKPKTVDIDLGGKVRTLRLDLNALCGLAEEGQDLDSLKLLLVAGRTTLLTVRLMLWAFLITDAELNGEANFSKKTLGGWIDTDNMAYCGKKLGEFINAQPAAKEARPEAATENPTSPE